MTTPALPPVVSVVIPCYQQADYLAEAVESVLAQTYLDWEIVIVDDGSTDASAAVAEQLMAGNPGRRLRLIRQANAGTPAARNAAIDASAGRYILPLDADDVLLPEMLEATVTVLAANPAVGIAYTDYQKFGTESGPVPTGAWEVEALCFQNPLGISSLYRREVWVATGGYNPNMAFGYEDWDFWMAAFERGFGAHRIARPLWRYRVHAGTRSSSAQRHDGALLRQLASNHPVLFTPSRRRRIALRRLPARLRGWVKQLVQRPPLRNPGRAQQ